MEVPPAERPLSIVVAYSRLPFPMANTDQKTVAHLIAFLAARGHAVDLYALDNGEPIGPEQRAWLDAHCRSVHLFPQGPRRSVARLLLGLVRGLPLQVGWFYNPAQIAAVRERLSRGDVDVGYAYYLRSAEAMRGLGAAAGRGGGRRPVTFLAMQLSQSLNTRRMVANFGSLRELAIYGVESRLIRPYEARIWAEFSRTVLIGRRDVDEIREICRRRGLREIDNVVYGPHGTDVRQFAPRPDIDEEPATVMFLGDLAINTNVHAVTWFADHVWPLVRQDLPEARLLVVGRRPRPRVVALAQRDGIEVTGEVRDPADYLARATVCVDPVQAGAGMQNKLLEYLAMGKAVVATSVANEGIGAIPGEHLVIADAPRDIADGVVSLCRDARRRAALGEAARDFVATRWTWEAQFLELEQSMYAALDEARGAASGERRRVRRRDGC